MVIRKDLPLVGFYTYTVVPSYLSCTSYPHPSISCNRSETTHYTLSSAYALLLIYLILSHLILSCLIPILSIRKSLGSEFLSSESVRQILSVSNSLQQQISAALAWRWWPGQTVRVWSASYECLGFKGASGVERVCVGRVMA